MSLDKNRRPVIDGPVTIGLTTASRPRSGLATIAAPAADSIFTLGDPEKGLDLTVLVAMNSTKVVTVRTNSSAQTFFGTTADRIVLTTGARPVSLRFVGLSATQWGVAAASPSTVAVFTLSASTR